MRKYIAAGLMVGALALAIPSSAMAAQVAGVHKKVPTVTYVLTGTISSFTPNSSAGAGSVSIMVSHSNFENKTLKGQSLTFTLGPKAKVVLHDHKPIAAGDKGIVKVRATKNDAATALESNPAMAVIDQGAARK